MKHLISKLLRNKLTRKLLMFIVFIPLFLLVDLLFYIKYAYEVFNNENEALDLGASKDQLANTIFNGNRDETISSRAGRHEKDECWAKVLCWVLDKVDENHCSKSIGK